MNTYKHKANIIKNQEQINDNFKELTDRVMELAMINSWLIGALTVSVFTLGIVLFNPLFKLI